MKFEIDIPELLSNLSGVYRIENDVDSRIYIGRSKHLMGRAIEHRGRLSKGGGNSKFKKFIKEHPDVTFRFTVEVFTNDIKAVEERLIEKYHAVENGFNMVHNDDEFALFKWEHTTRKERPKKVIKPDNQPIKKPVKISVIKVPKPPKRTMLIDRWRGYQNTRAFCGELVRMSKGREKPPIERKTKTAPDISSKKAYREILKTSGRRKDKGVGIIDLGCLCRK